MKSVYFKDQHGRIIEVRVADKWGQYMVSGCCDLELPDDGTARFIMSVNEEGVELPYAFKCPSMPHLTADSKPDSKNKLELCKVRPGWFAVDGKKENPCFILFETQLWELTLTDPYRIITWE